MPLGFGSTQNSIVRPGFPTAPTAPPAPTVPDPSINQPSSAMSGGLFNPFSPSSTINWVNQQLSGQPGSLLALSNADKTTSDNPWGIPMHNGQPVDYFSLTPQQQQAWSNGSVNSFLSGQPAPQGPSTGQSTDPLAGGWAFGGTPNSSPSTSNFFGTTIPVPSLDSLQAQQASYANNPYNTSQAYLDQQNKMMAQSIAATPQIYPQGWNDLTNSQQLALQYAGLWPDALSQQLPGVTKSQLLAKYQGPTTGLNAPLGTTLAGQSTQPTGQAQQTQQFSSALTGQPSPSTQLGQASQISPQMQSLIATLLAGLTGNTSAQQLASVVQTPLGYTQYQTQQPQQTSGLSPQMLSILALLLSGGQHYPTYGGFGSGLGGL